jgi:hypothetical protein
MMDSSVIRVGAVWHEWHELLSQLLHLRSRTDSNSADFASTLNSCIIPASGGVIKVTVQRRRGETPYMMPSQKSAGCEQHAQSKRPATHVFNIRTPTTLLATLSSPPAPFGVTQMLAIVFRLMQ